jgi:hypothetical protein
MNNEAKDNKFLFNEIRNILLRDWDPIGVQEIPEAQDEYDSYVDSICKLIKLKKSEKEIFNYLWWIETEYMGLSGDKKHTKIIAHKLFKMNSEF